MLYLKTAGMTGHFTMKVEFFNRCLLEIALVILLAGACLSSHAQDQTQSDRSRSPAWPDNPTCHR